MSPKGIVKLWLTSRPRLYFIIIFTATILLLAKGPGVRGPVYLPYDPKLFSIIEGSIFEGFDNNTGTVNGSYIVPNYIHFLFFGKPRISYVYAVCILAAFKNQRPDKIFFHTDVEKFEGRHWLKIKETLGDTLIIEKIALPHDIFGLRFRLPYDVWHASDVTRIRILMKHGGIFLDNDSYIVRSLDPFRRYEMTIGVTDGEFLGTMVLIAHKEARFLKLWLESYRDYRPYSWYYNAGQKPMKEILNYKPELVYKVDTALGVRGLTERLYVWDEWKNWRKYYSIHLVVRHRYYKDTIWSFLKRLHLDETNICDYNKPFGEMAREVYSDFCPKITENIT